MIEGYMTSPLTTPGLLYNATNLLANTVGAGMRALGFEGVNGPAVPFSERGVSMFGEPAPYRSDAYYERTSGATGPLSGGGSGRGDNERGAANTGSVSDIRGRDDYGDEVGAV